MKRDIKINVSVLWVTHSRIIAYRDAITDMETASANFLKVLESQDSKAYERLAEVWNQNVQVQESELKSRLSDIAQVLSDYIRDMESYIMPNDESQMMRVDRNDIWWNYTQIAQSATDFWDILGDTGSSWRDYDKHYWYNPFLSEEENDDRKQAQEDEEDAEQGRRERNYDKLADFRQTLSGKMTNELHEYVLAIQKIHNDNVIPFENTDDTYKTKMDDLYSEWASFWDRVTDVWDVIVDVGRGLFDAVKDLVVGILSLAVGVLEVVAWLGLKGSVFGTFGLIPDSLEEDVYNIFNSVTVIFRDPGNALEAMGQSIFDIADEEGIAYSISYVTSDIVIGILLDKGIGKLADAKKGADVAKVADDVPGMVGSASKGADVRNIVNTNGARNDLPLTQSQIDELVSYAKSLGFPEDKIYIADAVTSSNTGMLYDEILLINNDVLPTKLPTSNPNSLVSGKGTIAHEVIGHYETALKGTSFSQYDLIDNQLVRNAYNAALDEAQASIRAARFAPELTFSERAILIRDGLQRLRQAGLKLKDVKHLLDIMER